MIKKILIVSGLALTVVAAVIMLFVGQNIYINNDELSGTLSITDDYQIRLSREELQFLELEVYKEAYGQYWDIFTFSVPWTGFENVDNTIVYNNLVVSGDSIASNRNPLSPVEKVVIERIVFDIHTTQMGYSYLSLNSYEGVTVHSKFNVVYLLQWLEQVQAYQELNRPIMPEQGNDIVFVAEFIGYIGMTIKWGADWIILPVVLIGGAFLW